MTWRAARLDIEAVLASETEIQFERALAGPPAVEAHSSAPSSKDFSQMKNLLINYRVEMLTPSQFCSNGIVLSYLE